VEATIQDNQGVFMNEPTPCLKGFTDYEKCFAPFNYCPERDCLRPCPVMTQGAADLSAWTKIPSVRIAVDAKGYVWRVYGKDAGVLAGYWSMAPVNPDNSPVPQPVVYYVPEERALKAEATLEVLAKALRGALFEPGEEE
jgi:hypothetical protein